MALKNRVKSFVVMLGILGLAVLLSHTAFAATVLSNFPGANTAYTTINTDDNTAVGVTVPAGSDYELNFVNILANLGGSNGTHTMTLTVRENAAGDVPGTTLFTVDTATISASGTYTFTPASTITLQAGETYWFVMTGSAPSTGIPSPGWANGFSNAPTGTFSFVETNSSTNGGSSWSFTSVNPYLEIDASVTTPPPTSTPTPTPPPGVTPEPTPVVPQYRPAFSDERINDNDAAAPVAVYAASYPDGMGLHIYDAYASQLLLVVTPEQIAAVADDPAENTLIAANDDGRVSVYRLQGGMFQINAPMSNGKTYVLNFAEIFPDVPYTSHEIE